MGIVTTRRLDELRLECDKASVPWKDEWGRLELMDALRASLGAFDASTEIDPMKAKDLKHDIRWEIPVDEGRFDGIRRYLTPDWIAEPKLDGARLRMFMGLTGNSMNTGRRSVRTFAYTQRTDNFPHLRDAVVPELAGVILDGEVISPVAKLQTHTGTWTNSLLNSSVALCNSNPAGAQLTQRRFGKAQYWVFDVLCAPQNGELLDLTDMPYTSRRMVLERIVWLLQATHPECEIRIVPQLPATVTSITASIEGGFEGVMLKKLTGPYQAGKRSSVWLKVKQFSTADAFVTGYAAGLKGNTGLVGSLDLSVRLPDGSDRAVAQVGNLTHEMRVAISAEDGSLKSDFYGTVIEWQAQGLGKNGRARHAHMVRIRPDKDPADCLADQLDVFPAV